ncbi:MAG: oligosaccharide flippase family protein [Bacteroidales bacterium]|nr:oligosaccharide flippase family protein [Bacteroidales bacterium]
MEYIHKLKESSLFKDSLWSLLGNTTGYGLALIAGIIVARFLGKDIYGEYGMIKSTLLNIAVFSTFGLGYTVTKFVAESKNKANQCIRQITFSSINITLVTSTLFALFLFFFSKHVATYLNAVHLSLSLRIFAVIIIFNALSTVQIGILAGFNEFKSIAINKGIVGITTFVLSVILTYFWEIEGALSALLIATILNCVLNNIIVRKKLQPYSRIERSTENIVKQLLLFSLPITLQEGVYSITHWLCIAILVKLSNYGEVGLYSAAIQWSGIILFIPGILKNVALSHLSGTNDNITQHKIIFKRMLFVSFISTLIPCLIVFIFADFISSFYGESFIRLPLILNISVFTTIFTAMQTLYIQNYISMNKIWIHFYLSASFNILTLVLAFLLISNNVINGAYMLILSQLVISIIRLLTYHLVFINKN